MMSTSGRFDSKKFCVCGTSADIVEEPLFIYFSCLGTTVTLHRLMIVRTNELYTPVGQ